MDAYLFVAFFFPLIVAVNFGVLVLSFFLSLWIGFGGDFANYFDKEFTYFPTGISSWLRDPPFYRITWFYPLLFNLFSVFSIVGTYSLGYGFHSKGGWKWFQPGQGGIRFVLFQIQTWFCFACCICFPWLTVDEIGVLQMFRQVSPASEDRHSYGGLLVMSSVSGILAFTYALCGLLAYDSNAKKIHRVNLFDELGEYRQEMEVGSWNFGRVFGNNEVFWWGFVALEICVTFYSCALALLVDYRFLRNPYIQTMALLVYMGFLITTVAITNSVGGKWRYGPSSYRNIMPFQGGTPYMILQGVSWTSFALSLVFTLWKIYNTFTIASYKSGGLMRVAGFLGLLSEVLLVASLFLFDPSKVDRGLMEQADKDSTVSEPLRQNKTPIRRGRSIKKSAKGSNSRKRSKSKGVAEDSQKENATDELVIDRIIGKRPSPKMHGTIEYLVQWRAPYGIRWENQPSLLKKANNTKDIVIKLINAYEAQLADMVNQSLKKDNLLLNKQSLQTKNPSRRSKSPAVRISKDLKLNHPQQKAESNHAGEVWEECEDELGNVYYFSITTGTSVAELPKGYTYSSS